MSSLKKSSDVARAWWAALRTSPTGMRLNRGSELKQLDARVWFRKETGSGAAPSLALASRETKAMEPLAAEVQGIECYEQSLLETEEQTNGNDYNAHTDSTLAQLRTCRRLRVLK